MPRPSRASYPCQRATAPLAAAFVSYLLGLAGSALAFRRARRLALAGGSALAAACVVVGLAVAALPHLADPGAAAHAEDTGTFTPSDPPNHPLGTARGLHPGRVAWAHDPGATRWDGSSNYWFSRENNDQTRITALLDEVVCSVAGRPGVPAAWDALFKYRNGGAAGYVKGETIAVKLNLNNGSDDDNQIDASPQAVYALLDQLVNRSGVEQADVVLLDPAREGQVSAVRDYCKSAFPRVRYNTDLGGWVADAIRYSAPGPEERSLSKAVYDAKYLIVMALLKRHCTVAATFGTDGVDYGNAAVTMIFKSNWGLLGPQRGTASMHALLRDWRHPLDSYHVLVDLEGSRHVDGKTVLNVLDGLYSGDRWSSPPHRWHLAPFADHWPSSFFASQDPVALDSVGLDFLRAEMPLIRNADRFLHEAAQADNPPSGTVYQPDGVRLRSLGVHEHWNDPGEKKYSRNLGTGAGIELVDLGAGRRRP